MRTEIGGGAALLALALLCASPARAEVGSRVQVGASAEVTLVGLTYGIRPELTYRLGGPGVASRLRATAGTLVGPEYFYLPVSLGYRAVYREDRLLRPLLGVGLEWQNRMVSDAPVASALGIYLETGLLFGIGERLAAGLVTSIDVTFLGSPGAGLNLRASVTWAL